MKIQLWCKRSAVETFSGAGAAGRKAGYARDEVLVTATFVGVVIAILYGAFSLGFPAIQSARENLCATRMVMQKAEALDLFTGSQVRDASGSREPLFVETRDAQSLVGDSGAVEYAGYLSAATPLAGDLPSAPRAHMRDATLTLCWTSPNGAKPVVHTREIRTRLARNGAPKYVWTTF